MGVRLRVEGELAGGSAYDAVDYDHVVGVDEERKQGESDREEGEWLHLVSFAMDRSGECNERRSRNENLQGEALPKCARKEEVQPL